MQDDTLETGSFRDTDLEHVMSSIAISLKRIADFLDNAKKDHDKVTDKEA